MMVLPLAGPHAPRRSAFFRRGMDVIEAMPEAATRRLPATTSASRGRRRRRESNASVHQERSTGR